jgi:hypothetical protein
VNIPVSGINIGPVHKRDVLRANVMNEKGSKKFAVILAFDVPVSREAREMAQGELLVYYVILVGPGPVVAHVWTSNFTSADLHDHPTFTNKGLQCALH